MTASLRILHLGAIDSDFVDYLVARFEQLAPGANELVRVGEDTGRRREFGGPTTWTKPRTDAVEPVLERAKAADVVVVHAMTDFATLVCAQLPPGPLLVWSGYGVDYYVNDASKDLYGPLTLELIPRVTKGARPSASGRLVREAEAGHLGPMALDVLRHAAARRADYFSAPSPADFEVFKRAFPSFSGEYRQLNYGDVRSMCRPPEEVVTGDNILLGNSATMTNNHREAFRVLARCDLGDRRVVVPLTYGSAGYRRAILRIGSRVLGENFHPIVDHLPLEEYLELLSSCGITVLNHRRQQGIGNIAAALYQGSALHLNRANPLFGWLRSEGVAVQPVGALADGLPTAPVPPETLARHRDFVERTWGLERVEANLRSLLEELTERVSASVRQERPRRGLLPRRSR